MLHRSFDFEFNYFSINGLFIPFREFYCGNESALFAESTRRTPQMRSVIKTIERCKSVLNPQEQSPTTPSTAQRYCSPQIILPMVVETTFVKRSITHTVSENLMSIFPIFALSRCFIRFNTNSLETLNAQNNKMINQDNIHLSLFSLPSL